jgi:TRAP-type C4-dicarboxylate transport system permease large subunit
VPLILPIAAAFGIDATHLAIIFLANLELGYLPANCPCGFAGDASIGCASSY